MAAHNVPRCNAQQEVAFANRMLEHWTTHTSELVFSFTAISEDALQLPSPLLSACRMRAGEPRPPIDRDADAVESYFVNDHVPLTSAATTGGTVRRYTPDSRPPRLSL